MVAIRDSRVLLVLKRGATKYSLPGGGVRKGEPSIVAAARQLHEGTGLNCSRIELQFMYEGRTQSHKVFCATPVGHARLNDGELSQFIWWDRNHDLRDIPVQEHVAGILGRMNWLRQKLEVGK